MNVTLPYQDILYENRGGAAWITINRPEVYNAFRGQTIEELIHAFLTAASDKAVACVVLTGSGDKAFCTGGDQSSHDGDYDGRGVVGLPIDELQSAIRDIPKPVIAAVNGFAIGGGNVLATLCDMTIASEADPRLPAVERQKRLALPFRPGPLRGPPPAHGNRPAGEGDRGAARVAPDRSRAAVGDG